MSLSTPLSTPFLLVTGASGQLGRLVIASLLARAVPANRIAALVRDPNGPAAAELAALGVQVRAGNYEQPETLASAFAGVDRLLLISSSEVGKRVQQHRHAIDAAVRAGVKLIAYTSILHAATSPLGLADEHRQTEAMLAASGVPFVLLRNGWYNENFAHAVSVAIASGTHDGSAGEGRIASAARADYALAAALVISARDTEAGKIYELAGDTSFTLAEFAADISRASGQPVAYRNLPEADLRDALIGAGLPAPFAALLADSDTGASKGGLFDDGHQLGKLIGRETVPISAMIAAVVKG